MCDHFMKSPTFKIVNIKGSVISEIKYWKPVSRNSTQIIELFSPERRSRWSSLTKSGCYSNSYCQSDRAVSKNIFKTSSSFEKHGNVAEF